MTVIKPIFSIIYSSFYRLNTKIYDLGWTWVGAGLDLGWTIKMNKRLNISMISRFGLDYAKKQAKK